MSENPKDEQELVLCAIAEGGDEETGETRNGDEDLESSAGPEPEVDGEAEDPPRLPGLGMFRQGKSPTGAMRRKPEGSPRAQLSAPERMLALDAWIRSKLPAKDFAALLGVSKHTLYGWKKSFERHGPAGLEDHPKGVRSESRLAEPTKRAILLLKEQNPDWGVERIHHVMLRSVGYSASAGAIANLLKLEGYVRHEVPTKPNPAKQPRFFERAHPNDLWQTDLFSFMLKRENRRVYLVGFMDDHSRFLVGYGLHATQSGAMVREVFKSAVVSFGAPREVLTDNGTQYYTWQGKSGFTQMLEKLGIHHIVAKPRRPQTLGKMERFWGTLWRECVGTAIFQGMEDARIRIGHFIDHYNFQRPHQAMSGLVPADRYFGAASTVGATLRARVAANALDLAKHGEPRKTFYLTGRVGDEQISLHGEGDKVVLTKDGGKREEVNLAAPGRRADPAGPAGIPTPAAVHAAPPAPRGTEEDSEEGPPGSSALDRALEGLREELLAVPDRQDTDPAMATPIGEDGAEDAPFAAAPPSPPLPPPGPVDATVLRQMEASLVDLVDDIEGVVDDLEEVAGEDGVEWDEDPEVGEEETTADRISTPGEPGGEGA